MKQQQVPNNSTSNSENEVETSEVQSLISNTEKLRQIADRLGFDAIADSEPTLFIRDWLNQFFGFGSAQSNISQKGNSGDNSLNAWGSNGKDRIKQKGRGGNDTLRAVAGPAADRIIQRGGNGKDVLKAMAGGGNDKIKQSGGKGSDELKAFGGKGNDRITQKGKRGNDRIKAKGGKGNDKIKQKGGKGNDTLKASGGKGNDKIKQKGGRGKDTLTAKGGKGNDKIKQKGGRGKDTLTAKGGKGNDKIKQKGGRGKDTLTANGGKGNDKIKQKGGRGNDTLIYHVSEGEDVVKMHGGKGTDTGIIHTHGHSVVVQDKKGKVLFASGGQNKNYTGGGTTIQVKSIENLDIRTPENEVTVPEVEIPETPVVTTPEVTTPEVTTPEVTTPQPNTSGKGPQICSVYTRSREVMFNEEAVKVYFNARDSDWDELTWDTKWTGSIKGSITNEGPSPWIEKTFNLAELGAQAGDQFTVATTVRNSKGETDSRNVTYDVIGEEITVWEVFFDSETVNANGKGEPQRIDPLIFDLNKDGKLDITGANQEGNGKIDGETVLFDMDPRSQGSSGWKWSSPGHRPGYYEGGHNSRAPKVPNGNVIYDTGKTESTNKAGVGRWFEDPSKGKKADIFDEKGNLVGQWDASTWGTSHGGRKGQYYWEPKGGGEKRERTEWIKGTGDGFLVWDHNNNGKIDDNTEMMSEFDIEGNKTFNNGFEKLAHYFDKDKDGIIKGNELNGLKFWVDDGDAITEDGELQDLSTYGILEIALPTAGGMTSKSISGKRPG